MGGVWAWSFVPQVGVPLPGQPEINSVFRVKEAFFGAGAKISDPVENRRRDKKPKFLSLFRSVRNRFGSGATSQRRSSAMNRRLKRVEYDK